MKARLHPTTAMQKAIDAYAEAKIQGIQSSAQEAVMKERSDIATRAAYLCLLACYQVGLSPRTLKRIQDAMTGPVADKYNEYRNDQLADLWEQVTLQSIIVLIFWPLLVVTRIGIAIYRIVRRLL